MQGVTDAPADGPTGVEEELETVAADVVVVARAFGFGTDGLDGRLLRGRHRGRLDVGVEAAAAGEDDVPFFRSDRGDCL